MGQSLKIIPLILLFMLLIRSIIHHRKTGNMIDVKEEEVTNRNKSRPLLFRVHICMGDHTESSSLVLHLISYKK